jgi:hypothetical protein
MQPSTVDTPTYQALSIGDKLRVSRFLARGEAPGDLRMAAAAVELAESYRYRGRVLAAWIRWQPLVMVVVFGAIAIPAAIAGNTGMTIISMLLVLGSVMHLMFNPAIRPKNVARSLEASRRVVMSGG